MTETLKNYFHFLLPEKLIIIVTHAQSPFIKDSKKFMLKFYMMAVNKDKTVVNPILGQVSCSALCEKHEECHLQNVKNRLSED